MMAKAWSSLGLIIEFLTQKNSDCGSKTADWLVYN